MSSRSYTKVGICVGSRKGIVVSDYPTAFPRTVLPSPSCEVTVTTDADSVLATRSGNEHVSHKEPRTSQLRRLWVLKLFLNQHVVEPTFSSVRSSETAHMYRL